MKLRSNFLAHQATRSGTDRQFRHFLKNDSLALIRKSFQKLPSLVSNERNIGSKGSDTKCVFNKSEIIREMYIRLEEMEMDNIF